MRTWLVTLVFAGTLLVGAVAARAAEPSPRPEASYEQTRELIRLGWLDLAEREIARLADANEAALARAWLAERRAGLERDARKQLAGYEAVARTLDELRKTPPKEERLQAELVKLDAAVTDARFRASCALLLDPTTTAAERQTIGAAIEAQQQRTIEVFREAMKKAEAEYAYALKILETSGDFQKPADMEEALRKATTAKNKAFDAYWRASARYVQEMIRFGEFWPAGCPQQRKLGGQIADSVVEWVKKQEKYEPLGPETAGVEMFMNYAQGHGWALAGETIKAVEAFNKAVAVRPEDMADPVQARAIWSRAVYYKARTLADAAEKSKKKADWKAALAAIDPAVFQDLPGIDRVLAIKARILRGKCHARLGALDAAGQEFDEALRAAEKMD
jgi:tetratricopeptide (TPR) repeat protein